MLRVLGPFCGPLRKAPCAPQSADAAEGFKQCLFFGNAQTARGILKPQQYRSLSEPNPEFYHRRISFVNCFLQEFVP